MISIAAPNESALVHQTAGDDVNREERTDSKASSIPPSLDGLSISTTSSTRVSDSKEKTIFSELREYDNGSEFNDCSSSLSSQDSGNVFNSNAAAKPCPKRSVFSQYWQKTRQKPVSLRPLKSLSTSDLCGSSSGSLSTTRDESRGNSSAGSTFDASSRSSKDSSFGTSLSCSVTTAELLEDDGVSSLYDDDDDDDDGEAQDSDATSHQPPTQPPPPTHNHPMRRRSILPPAPAANPVFRATFGKTTSAAADGSWRKSASLTNVEEYSRSVPLNSRHKTRSMPGTRSCSSSSLLRSPGRSCLRRIPKYSPNNNTASQRTTMASPPSASSLSVLSMQEESPALSRADSMTSSVSFQEAVDVRHFEPPRETYSGKGWSDYFSFETTEPI